MIDLKNIELDITLHELIQNKPSSRLKLIAAWDGLSIETQVKIINILKDKLPLKIFEKTLSSTNEYVRFLSNKYGQSSAPFLEAPCDLASYLAKKSVENDCSLFFSMTHEEQILTISSWRSPKNFSGLVEWALENKPIEQIQLDELTEEFVHNESILNYFTEIEWDGWSAYEKGKELDMLWSLIPKLGVTKSAELLVCYLPLESGLSSDRSEEFLESLNPEILTTFLLREDFYNSEFRKKIFFSPDESRNKYKLQLQGAATFCNLQLTAEEFHTLIQDKNFALLEELARSNSYRPALSPALLCALCDIGNSFIEHYHYYAKDKEQLILDFFKTRYEDDIDYTETKIMDIIEVALYSFAIKFVPWENPPENLAYLENYLEKLDFILKHIVPGDTWATYMAFSKAFSQNSHLFNIPTTVTDISSFIDDATEMPIDFILGLLHTKSPEQKANVTLKDLFKGNQKTHETLEDLYENEIKNKATLEYLVKHQLTLDYFYENALENKRALERLDEKTQDMLEKSEQKLSKLSQFTRRMLFALLTLVGFLLMK
ncbi:hypothetical protein OQJ15_14155 [Fluoribacter dumoffii]|uniref:hypothetical protein n=1 Tax=Fluoribacter dumoffii TaxID=463 RepID=UPI00026C8276|nr:hypothetical protein [Fluoribacter dumoffii]MCW8387449.1 hypothetical protein [Fluoribacter dumoffii]MCW8497652.1 hypothetical protein [Fluoribacter dumoffii]